MTDFARQSSLSLQTLIAFVSGESPHTSPARLVTALVVAASGIHLGVKLAAYADADDAPGGVLLGMMLMFGSLALGISIALRRARTPSPNDG